jgi:hypothetical protein
VTELGGIPLNLVGYSAGWAIVALVVVMIFRGLLLTPREARAMERRMEAQASTIEQQNRTIAEFVDAISTNNALLASLYDVARERR